MTQLQSSLDADRAMPVELLRDARGLYGIGVADLFDYEAVAWACGIETKGPWEVDYHRYEYPGALILRPDRFDYSKPHNAVLQKITGGFRHGMFTHTAEEHLRQFIHHEALNRRGLCWPPQRDHRDPAWWSHDPKWQAHNRRIYHGLRLNSLKIINRLIGTALEQAADADAIKAARRFTFNHRENIYRAGAQSRRALQLTDTFPVLALAIYADLGLWSFNRCDFSDVGDVGAHDAAVENFAARKKAAADLVERGARLRDVAAAMGLPMAMRRIKPGAAHVAGRFVREHPDLLHFMPEALPRSRNWLRLVRWADHNVNADYAEWVARNAAQIPGGLDQVFAQIENVADWVKAAKPNIPTYQPEASASGWWFVTRPFAPTMSLKTVTRLSDDWHEAVASNMSGPQCAFPPPWYPAAKLGAYDILSIDNSADLYREGAAMHHCAGTYGDAVKYGTIYIYSIRQNGERLATLELVRTDKRAAARQLRGPCNTQPPKAVISTVQRWLRAQGPLPERVLPGFEGPRQKPEADNVFVECEDGDIPF